MARTKVRNMGRKQQKAVFANIGNATTINLISDSDSKAKKKRLLKRYGATDTQIKLQSFSRGELLSFTDKAGQKHIGKWEGNIERYLADDVILILRDTTNQNIIYKVKGSILKREPEINKKSKNMGYKELKKSGIKLNPKGDADGDGVKNSKDCRPLDKDKQHIFSKNPIKIPKHQVRLDKYTGKYEVKPRGKGYYWSERLLVDESGREGDVVPKNSPTHGGWVKNPTLTGALFPITLSNREDRKRSKLQKLVNERGLNEGYREYNKQELKN